MTHARSNHPCVDTWRRTGRRTTKVAAATVSVALAVTTALGATGFGTGTANALNQTACTGGNASSSTDPYFGGTADCRGSRVPVLGAVLKAIIPADTYSGIEDMLGDVLASAAVAGTTGSTATITGDGIAFAYSLYSSNGSSEADTVGPLSAAIAINANVLDEPGAFSGDPAAGNARAIALPLGAAISVTTGNAGDAGDGNLEATGDADTTAVALGGLGAAWRTKVYGFGGSNGVSCMAALCYASNGTTTEYGIGWLFNVQTTTDGPGITFNISDPTSLTTTDASILFASIPIPVFSRNLLSVTVGGDSPISVGSDVLDALSGAASAVSAHASRPSSGTAPSSGTGSTGPSSGTGSTAAAPGETAGTSSPGTATIADTSGATADAAAAITAHGALVTTDEPAGSSVTSPGSSETHTTSSTGAGSTASSNGTGSPSGDGTDSPTTSAPAATGGSDPSTQGTSSSSGTGGHGAEPTAEPAADVHALLED
ncbi:hypothetical protein P0W64_19075 [Tsukamurella sp. 8F]|uniref:hypothetical protein n=1 Tax=unclassified Tsukamurella TaxID=2633480 RepID=UPI0023B9AC0F|nr:MULTISPECIES: hypothetical protein [unclassified Tsukamurella]MDF0531989.1 hypothetical protein [Tsukamurella sp. 8J]MDF0588888.1 hypothetical protein [Tsukamurella sp. 8F]